MGARVRARAPTDLHRGHDPGHSATPARGDSQSLDGSRPTRPPTRVLPVPRPPMLELFLAALVLGVVFNATPGAVFAETVRHAVRGGFRPAFAVQVGSLAGDATWAVLGLTGVGVLMQSETLRLPIGLAGAAYLLWLAVDAWRAASREFAVDAGATPAGAPLRAGVVLSMTNPQNVAFWAAIGSALGALGVTEPRAEHYLVFFAGFMTASVAWAVVCAGALAVLFRRASDRWARLTYRLCAIALLALALASLRGVVGELGPRAQNGPTRTCGWLHRIVFGGTAFTPAACLRSAPAADAPRFARTGRSVVVIGIVSAGR